MYIYIYIARKSSIRIRNRMVRLRNVVWYDSETGYGTTQKRGTRLRIFVAKASISAIVRLRSRFRSLARILIIFWLEKNMSDWGYTISFNWISWTKKKDLTTSQTLKVLENTKFQNQPNLLTDNMAKFQERVVYGSETGWYDSETGYGTTQKRGMVRLRNGVPDSESLWLRPLFLQSSDYVLDSEA